MRSTRRPRPRLDVIRDATLEVRGPVVYATLVVLAVFLPELFSTSLQAFPGAAGAGLYPGGAGLADRGAYRRTGAVGAAAQGPGGTCRFRLGARPEKLAAARHFPGSRQISGLTLVVLGVLTLAAVIVLPLLPSTFMPDFREGHFVMQVDASTPGASLAEMADVGKRISAEILALPYVATVSQQIGRADLGEDTNGPHMSEFHVEMKPNATVDQSEAEDALRRIAGHYPGLQGDVRTFLGDRIDESLTGRDRRHCGQVFGDQLDNIDTTAQKVVQTLQGTPGIADLQFKPQRGVPTLMLQLQPATLAGQRPQIGRCAGCGADRLRRPPRWGRPIPATGRSMW